MPTLSRLFAMMFAVLALAGAPHPAVAGGPALTVTEAYAIAATPMARSGAVYMVIANTGPTDDRLLAAATDAAERAEFHGHSAGADGMMSMAPIAGGIALPAGAGHTLARGGDHLMLLGLTRPLLQGDTITLTLTFEVAGDIQIEVPVDLTRDADPADMGDAPAGHGAHVSP